MSFTDSSEPQFSTAEYHAPEGTDVCRYCHNPVNGTYYRMNGEMACTACVQQAELSLPKDSHAAFTRALLFGAGGALLGLILYSAVGIVTGLEIGYVSLAVGWLVGKAISKGSGGVGGRRYQIAAVLLTYAAVSISAVPIGISVMIKQKKAETVQTQQAQDSNDSTDEQAAPAEPVKKMSAAAAIGALALYGLASPFLGLQSPLSGIIGIFILLIGIRIAWQMTAGPALKIEGPY